MTGCTELRLGKNTLKPKTNLKCGMCGFPDHMGDPASALSCNSQEPSRPKGPAASLPPSTQPPCSSSPAAAETSLEGRVALAQKQIRALQKKLRQCEALQSRISDGATLSQEEMDKVDKYKGW